MPELQEASENMLFYSAEIRHLGTTGCPAEHRDKAHDQKFAKVVTRVVGPGIGDEIESSEENVHAGKGLQKGDPRSRIHPAQDRKTPRIRSNPKRDSPGNAVSGLTSSVESSANLDTILLNERNRPVSLLCRG